VGLDGSRLVIGGSNCGLGGGLKKTEIEKKIGTLDGELEQ